jgi:hypothetical protein
MIEHITVLVAGNLNPIVLNVNIVGGVELIPVQFLQKRIVLAVKGLDGKI